MILTASGTIRAAALSAVELPTFAPSPSPRFSVSFGPTSSSNGLKISSGRWDSPRGTDLLERPKFDQSQFDPLPQPQQGGDMGKLPDKVRVGGGDSYRVLLIDNPRHTVNLVEKVLPQAVPTVTVSDAREHFHESRMRGVAVVIVTVKEHAEFYAEMMVQWGLQSAIEPDSNGCMN